MPIVGSGRIGRVGSGFLGWVYFFGFGLSFLRLGRVLGKKSWPVSRLWIIVGQKLWPIPTHCIS
jgi:hypothetical protein